MTSVAARPDPPRRCLGARLQPLAQPLFWLFVVGCGAWGVESALGNGRVTSTGQVELVALALVGAAATAASLRQPVAMLVVTYLAALSSTLVDPKTVAIGGPSAILIAYLAGRRRTGWRLGVGLGAACVLFAVARGFGDWDMAFGAFVAIFVMFILGPAAVGRGVRDREGFRAVMKQRAAAEEADRQERTSRALLDERARIAGELHDVVAHALSAMVVQASGARLFALRDESRAEQAFASVERTGRDALFEIRSLLGVLRDDGDDGAGVLEPQPTLEHVGALALRTERSGLPTTVRTRGEARRLPAGVSLTGYRALQDALRAARDDGGAGRAEIVVRYEPGGVRLSVIDDGPGDRAPLAVRERVQLYGGELTTAATGDGHRVDIRLRTEHGE